MESVVEIKTLCLLQFHITNCGSFRLHVAPTAPNIPTSSQSVPLVMNVGLDFK